LLENIKIDIENVDPHYENLWILQVLINEEENKYINTVKENTIKLYI
jgi:hypothetical protein